MSTRRQPVRKRAVAWSAAAVMAALLLVSINLRPAITTMAAVMGKLAHGYGVDSHLLPVLGALPVLAFGISAPLGPWLAKWLGTGWAVGVALLVLAAALAARALVPGFIFPGTFLAGRQSWRPACCCRRSSRNTTAPAGGPGCAPWASAWVPRLGQDWSSPCRRRLAAASPGPWRSGLCQRWLVH